MTVFSHEKSTTVNAVCDYVPCGKDFKTVFGGAFMIKYHICKLYVHMESFYPRFSCHIF